MCYFISLVVAGFKSAVRSITVLHQEKTLSDENFLCVQIKMCTVVHTYVSSFWCGAGVSETFFSDFLLRVSDIRKGCFFLGWSYLQDKQGGNYHNKCNPGKFRLERKHYYNRKTFSRWWTLFASFFLQLCVACGNNVVEGRVKKSILLCKLVLYFPAVAFALAAVSVIQLFGHKTYF